VERQIKKIHCKSRRKQSGEGQGLEAERVDENTNIPERERRGREDDLFATPPGIVITQLAPKVCADNIKNLKDPVDLLHVRGANQESSP